jgi:hypothetical protein
MALWPWPGKLRADDARLVFSPASAQVQVGAEIEVQVRMENVSELYGLDLRLRFDPALIEIVDVNSDMDKAQVIEGTFPYPDFLVRNEADNSAGTIWYAVTQLNPREPVSGSGTMMTIRLRGRAVGTAYLDVNAATFVDNNGLELSVALSSGEVVVLSAGGAPTATRTPTATQTPQPAEQGTNPTLPAQPTSTRTPLPTLTLAVTSTPGTPGASTATVAASPGYPSPIQATLTPSLTPTAGPSPTPGQAPTVEAYPGLPTPAIEEQPTPAEPGPATETPAQGGEPPEAPDGYPGPGEPAPAPVEERASTLSEPAAPALPITMPALAALPTRAPAAPPVKPLVAREVFICFVALLAIFTLALGIYLWRRDHWGARRP